MVGENDLWERLSGRLVGIHLHDATGLEDHLPPGSGGIDFKALLSHLAPGLPAVLELRPGTPEDAIRSGLAHLAALADTS